MKFVIISGLSGAGKSQTVKHMEDFGYYCVDNLPPSLIPKFMDLCYYSNSEINKIALVIDIRGGLFFNDLFDSLDAMKKMKLDYEILFLDASDEVLIKRFKETRREHPLSANGSINEGIIKEREKLSDLREVATNIIDTTNIRTAQLREELRNIFIEGNKSDSLMISILSFGFKHGIPLDADLVFDVRFLPNPFYIDTLKTLTGKDEVVRKYVMDSNYSIEFTKKLFDLINFLIPAYIKEGKNRLVIAIGCTGGRHRSVTISYLLHKYLKEKKYRARMSNRDID
ncbi:MAG: RNase adapter RapZ [Alkaliphilus sp.]|nr:RNase adapter RapZ [Alkaliphilus sp. AH-315-G20]PHS34233.1 MAG: RNase adapter RapZ [Alkaliphilus sp.]